MIKSNSLVPVSELSKLAIEINNWLLSTDTSKFINPISKHIILQADIYNKPQVVIFAVSLLRYNDVANLMLTNALLSDVPLIYQGKTRSYVAVDFSVIPFPIRKKIFFINKSYEVVNYVRLSSFIRGYISFYLTSVHFTFNHQAHIFRHLEASYRKYVGNSPENIQKKLGHLDKNSQNAYFHNSLEFIFSQLK